MADRKEFVVADGQTVTLDYVLRLDDGEVYEESEANFPLEFVQGQGQIIKGLESGLYGMQIGEEREIVVKPLDGYGEYDSDDLEIVPRNSLPKDLELSVGSILQFRDAETNEVHVAIVAKYDDHKVLMDFNHPLAGETLHFQVRVIDLRRAATGQVG